MAHQGFAPASFPDSLFAAYLSFPCWLFWRLVVLALRLALSVKLVSLM